MKAGSNRSLVLLVVGVVGVAAAPGRGPPVVLVQGASGDSLTFNRDIAPLLFARCATCHHPNGSAPFDLLSYRDVQLRLPLIVDAIERRSMPPWVPASKRWMRRLPLSATKISPPGVISHHPGRGAPPFIAAC